MTEDIKQKAVDIYPTYPIRQLPNWSEYIDHLRSAYVDGYSLAEQEIERLKNEAQQEAIAFTEWKDKFYIQHPNGYFSTFNDGSHGKSHITPKFYTLTELYNLYQQSKQQTP